jgi:hypothetical protein
MSNRNILAALGIVAMGATACATSGYKKAENLADTIDVTVAAVDAHDVSRQASLDSMDSLVAKPHDNLAARFEAFNASVDRVVSTDAKLRGAVEAMKASATKRFDAWGEQNRSYADKDMRVQSEESREDAEEAFGDAARDADGMVEQSAGFVSYLSDLRKVLSNDLSEKGVADAADFAAKARTSSGKLDDMVRPIRKSLGAAADKMSPRDGSR